MAGRVPGSLLACSTNHRTLSLAAPDSPPLAYQHLVCDKDKRKYKNKKKVHIMTFLDKTQIGEFQRKAAEQLKAKEETENSASWGCWHGM